MGQVISGHVFYSRKTKPGDYEHEQADVRLDFNVMDGETPEATMQAAAKLAKAQAHAMLGSKAGGTETLPAQLAKPAEVASATGATKADLIAAAATAAGAPKSGTADAAPKAAAKPPKAAKKVEEPKPAETPAADAGTDDMADLLGAAPAEVTDAELIAKVTATNGRIKNPAAIKELTAKFVAFPKGVKDIPQELRGKYIAELEALKPAG